MIQKEFLVVDGNEVAIDPNNLKFSESTLSDYLKQEGGWYDNFGGYLARAERELQLAESHYDNLYNLKFHDIKTCKGGSDKLAEAGAKMDLDVQKALKVIIDLKYNVSRLKNHLKSWDKNHENAQSVGHTLRREMNYLGNDIRVGNDYDHRTKNNNDYDAIDSIITHIDPENLESDI